MEGTMKTDLGKKTILYPMPVLMVGTYDKKGKPDLMAAAWGGIFNDNMVCLCLDKSAKGSHVKRILPYSRLPRGAFHHAYP